MPALGLDFERTLHAQLADVRNARVVALGEARFKVTAQQLTRVEAKRGSKFLGDALMVARLMPLAVSIELTANAAGSSLVGHFVDQHINLGGKAWGLNESYRRLFTDALAAIDSHLARLDPQAAAAFGPGQFWSKGGAIGVLEQVQTRSIELSGAVFDKANHVLEGGTHDDHPAAWKGVDSVTAVGSEGVAVLSLADTEAYLGVGVMIASDPGSMPPNLRADVEAYASRVERVLSSSAGAAVTITLAPTEEPVFVFLHQQARIRDGLPARTLHVCRTCHFEKITNEDYERIAARNRTLTTIVGGIGATVSGGSIQPFIVLGQLFRLKKLDPDYVCPRCQGMEADEHLITFCSRCGDMRREAVLGTCTKCAYDFRSALSLEVLWQPRDPAEAAVRGPAESPQAAPPSDSRLPPPASTPIVTVAAAPLPTAAPDPSTEPTASAAVHDPGATVATPVPLAVSSNGTPLPSAPTPSAPTPSATTGPAFCPFCGLRLGAGFAFCPGCGARI